MQNLQQNQFGFLSFKKTEEALDASKFFIYSLVKKRIIEPYYFEFDENGKGKGKPYFRISDLVKSLHPSNPNFNDE